MNLFDLIQTENSPIYQELQVSNLDRQYDFLRSIVKTSIDTQTRFVSHTIIKAFNYHAIVCLHSHAGRYRKINVKAGTHVAPEWLYVKGLMEHFVNEINFRLETMDPIHLATWALWRFNWIHPFVNGNGRTARLLAYYILCIKAGGMLGGTIALPELLRRQRGQANDPYVLALEEAHASLAMGAVNLTSLHNLMVALLNEQLNSATQP